jgi:hypothetical protein
VITARLQRTPSAAVRSPLTRAAGEFEDLMPTPFAGRFRAIDVIVAAGTVGAFVCALFLLSLVLGMAGWVQPSWTVIVAVSAFLGACVLRRRGAVDLGSVIVGACAATLLSFGLAWLSLKEFGYPNPLRPLWECVVASAGVILAFRLVHPAPPDRSTLERDGTKVEG